MESGKLKFFVEEFIEEKSLDDRGHIYTWGIAKRGRKEKENLDYNIFTNWNIWDVNF